MLKISELIEKLEKFKEEFGDLPIIIRRKEYWGSEDDYLDFEYHVYLARNARPERSRTELNEITIVFDSKPM